MEVCKLRFKGGRILSLSVIAVLGSLLALSATAAATGPITDIPQRLANTLEISIDVARLILSSSIMFALGLAMAVAGKRANMVATMVVLIIVGAVLVAIGWLDYWVMFLVAVIAAVMFAGHVKIWVEG